jgi:hypothetical protein
MIRDRYLILIRRFLIQANMGVPIIQCSPAIIIADSDTATATATTDVAVELLPVQPQNLKKAKTVTFEDLTQETDDALPPQVKKCERKKAYSNTIFFSFFRPLVLLLTPRLRIWLIGPISCAIFLLCWFSVTTRRRMTWNLSTRRSPRYLRHRHHLNWSRRTLVLFNFSKHLHSRCHRQHRLHPVYLLLFCLYTNNLFLLPASKHNFRPK